MINGKPYSGQKEIPMPFIKRHRGGKAMPKVVHPEPDERATPLCEELVKVPAVQAVILGGSRYRGGWDEQSDLDIIVILEEHGDEEENNKTARLALAELKERYYPGYRDYQHPDHEVAHGHIVASMEYFQAHRRTQNDPMSQAARQGRIFAKKPGTEEKYEHNGDTSNEWELVTLRKLERAAEENRSIPSLRMIYGTRRMRELIPYTIPGRTAYWILWCSGSAVMSILGVMYENRSLVAMAETLRERDPRWNHRFASDLDCLDQYNYCACEFVVTDPITDLDAMWEALETDRDALWERIRELTGYELNEPPPEISSGS